MLNNSINSLKAFGSVVIEALPHLFKRLKSFNRRPCEPIPSLFWLFPHAICLRCFYHVIPRINLYFIISKR